MEATRSTNAPQRAATHETRGTRHAAKAAEQDGAQPKDGFSLLLAALGDGASAVAQDDPLDPAAAGALSALGADPALQPPLLPSTLSPAALAAQAAADAASLAALAGAPVAGAGQGQGQGAGLASLADSRLGSAAVSGLDALWSRGAGKAGVDSLVGQTAMLDGATESAAVNGAPVANAAAPMRGMAGRFQSAWAAAGLSGAADASAAPGAALRAGAAEAGKTGTHDAASALLSATTAATASTVSIVSSDHRDSAGLNAAAAAQRGAGDPSQMLSTALFAGQPEAAAADGRSGRGGEGAAGSNAAALTAPGEPGHEVPGADAFATDLSGAAADPSQLTAEDQLAEQVAYWVHQKTQNAELTLDRDGQPVQVTVSLTGSEAHIAFRSDQAHTRDLLDSSVAQLRDLLQAEGLQLSGVTVGTSGESAARDGAGQSGSGNDRGRQGARQATVQSSAPLGAVDRSRQGAGERAVDIFV